MSKTFLVLIAYWVGMSIAQAEVLNVYQVIPGVSAPTLLGKDAYIGYKIAANDTEQMYVRVNIKKFIIEKTESGPTIKFTPVCEKNVVLTVKDMTGGGLISEDVIMSCESTYKSKKFDVILSGMIYDSEVADFTDEEVAWTRNFFAHLSLSGEIITGLGDFNLDTTRDKNLQHLSAALSIDPGFGQGDKKREGFTLGCAI